MRFQAKTFLHGVLVMFAFGALGQIGHANEISGLYFGGNAGTAQIDYDNALYQKQLEGQVTGIGSLDFTDSSLRKRNAAWWVDAGYMLSPYFGIEADYLHFGALYNHVNGKYTPNGGNRGIGDSGDTGSFRWTGAWALIAAAVDGCLRL
jgi:hypothetical protein